MPTQVITCPHCNTPLSLDEAYFNQEVQCPGCSKCFVATPNLPPSGAAAATTPMLPIPPGKYRGARLYIIIAPLLILILLVSGGYLIYNQYHTYREALNSPTLLLDSKAEKILLKKQQNLLYKYYALTSVLKQESIRFQNISLNWSLSLPKELCTIQTSTPLSYGNDRELLQTLESIQLFRRQTAQLKQTWNSAWSNYINSFYPYQNLPQSESQNYLGELDTPPIVMLSLPFTRIYAPRTQGGKSQLLNTAAEQTNAIGKKSTEAAFVEQQKKTNALLLYLDQALIQQQRSKSILGGQEGDELAIPQKQEPLTRAVHNKLLYHTMRQLLAKVSEELSQDWEIESIIDDFEEAVAQRLRQYLAIQQSKAQLHRNFISGSVAVLTPVLLICLLLAAFSDLLKAQPAIAAARTKKK